MTLFIRDLQRERERICRFREKLVSSPERKRVLVVPFPTHSLRNKELLVTPGQQSVVLADERLRVGHSLPNGNYCYYS